MKTLVKFSTDNKSQNFTIYGDFKIDNNNMPEYENLKIELNGNPDYQPEGHTWIGHKYESEDVINTVIESQILNNDTLDIEFICDEIKEYINSYYEKIVAVNNRKLPLRIFKSIFMRLYDLFLVTNDYAYYMYINSPDLLLMIDVNTGRIVSDNYFAEEGLAQSVENIKNDVEKIIYVTDKFEL